MRFGERLWVCPHHEQVDRPAARSSCALDPGPRLRHRHPCQHRPVPDVARRPRRGRRARHRLWLRLGRARRSRPCELGARARTPSTSTHRRCSPPAKTPPPTASVAACTSTHRPRRCPRAATCCSRTSCPAPCARWRRRSPACCSPAGEVVLAGILEHEVPDVTAAYAAWFDVARFGGRDGWVGAQPDAAAETARRHVHSLPKMRADPGRDRRRPARRAGLRALRPLLERLQCARAAHRGTPARGCRAGAGCGQRAASARRRGRTRGRSARAGTAAGRSCVTCAAATAGHRSGGADS